MILTCAIHDDRDPTGVCTCSDIVAALRLSAADVMILKALSRAIARVGLEESATYLALIDKILTTQDSGHPRPSRIDQRRLRDGAAALAASRTLPRTRVTAVTLLEQVSDAIRAMQSLDDLGEAGNAQAVQDLDELGRRHSALAAQIKRLA